MLQREKLFQKTRRKTQDRFARRNSTGLYDEERVQSVFQAPQFIFQVSNTPQRFRPHAQCEQFHANGLGHL